MAKLVIKGHNSRGKEVIETLKMLGGKTDASTMLAGDLKVYGYYINPNGLIEFKHYSGLDYDNDIIYTLEQFLEKYPYKVGDKVTSLKGIGVITEMKWLDVDTEVRYRLSIKNDIDRWFYAYNLQPYKEEETMEEIGEDSYVCNKLDFTQEPAADKVELILGDYEIKEEDGKTYLVKKKPQYPKTYKECCDVLGLSTMDNDAQGYKGDLIIRFQELIIARDAYWKIAGEQMGLGKPWEPDWDNLSTNHEFIKIYKGCFIYSSRVLVFPTTEMRDSFYEKFKDLIEECKEFL